MIPLALFALTGCLALGPETESIRARDLSRVLSGLADSGAVISPAPDPGVPRVFRISELRRIAVHFGLEGNPEGEICFERPVRPPDPARLVEAMRRQLPQARIEILDYGHMPAPEGELEFPLTGLRRAGADGFWTGAVQYAGGRRFPLWARVRVAVRESRVVASEDLQPGREITAAQLRVETREVFPAEIAFAGSLEAVAGRGARIKISAGAAIRLDWLAPAEDVVRGDRVLVEVYSGAAYLKFEATAETSGTVGQVIAVTNPVSKKRFSAKVAGKGRVTVGKRPS